MRKIFRNGLLAAVMIAPMLLAATPASAQSFNCRYAKWPDEVAICQSPGLAALDEDMAALFYRIQNILRRQGRWAAMRALKRRQHRWLRRRHACGYDRACIRAMINRRINQLEGWLY